MYIAQLIHRTQPWPVNLKPEPEVEENSTLNLIPGHSPKSQLPLVTFIVCTLFIPSYFY